MVLIPSGTKSGKVFSQKPVNGDGDFTFSRSTAATRVNADGNIEKETSNLLLQSNSFNTTWFNSNSTETSGQSGYDGSSDAWLLESTGPSGSLRQSISYSSVICYSFYAKAGTVNYVRLRLDAATQVNAWFNLSSGSVGTLSDGISSSIESVGNGWWRVSVTANVTSLTTIRVYPSPNDAGGNSSGDNIYIQDAQLEQGLVARDYIETTTAAVEGGITDNVPRLDYTDSSCPALLLEPQRTNLVPKSEYVGGMTLQNMSATANATTSPEGVGNAYEVEPTGTGFKTIGNFVPITANLTYTISFFYKNIDHKNIGFYDNNTSGSEIQINVQDNTFTLGSNVINGNVEDYGNGWYRAYATFAASSGTLANYLIFRNDSNSGSYTATGSSIYVYGFQIEAGTYPTSYIPTYGTSVTRNVDKVDGQEDASLFNDSEGVLFVEFSALADSGRDNQWRFLISDGSNGNRVQIGLPNATNNLYASCIAGGVTSADMTHTLNNPSSNHKVAIKYKVNDFAMYVDGVEVDTDTSGSTPTGLDIFDFYRTPNNNNYVEANVNQVLYFKTALSNEELADLTTL